MGRRCSAVTSFCIVATSAPRAGGGPTSRGYIAYVIPHIFSRGDASPIPQDLRPWANDRDKREAADATENWN